MPVQAPALALAAQDLTALAAVSWRCWHGAGNLAIATSWATGAPAVGILCKDGLTFALSYPEHVAYRQRWALPQSRTHGRPPEGSALAGFPFTRTTDRSVRAIFIL